VYPPNRNFVAAFIVALACAESERIGSPPTEPPTSSQVAGSYDAVSFIVERDGSGRELVGEPDTRLNLHLNLNGALHGQLKIGTDPELRGKHSLVGTWRLRQPGSVTFQLRPRTFLNQTTFRISPPGLVGEWTDERVRISIKLEKTG
jgi:hypothetical protein